ncbi:MAG: hypothetical protein WC795_00130 [Candidatus Paceibacterota bacterium]|jgi:hypothetical protein
MKKDFPRSSYSVTLRKLSRKSKIGFGKYKDSTVGSLIDNKYYGELLSYYYRFDKIDFHDEIKNELMITKERRIEKPGKERDIKQVKKFMILCLRDIYEKNGKLEDGKDLDQTPTPFFPNSMVVKLPKKDKKKKVHGLDEFFHSKSRNQAKNHGRR